MKISPELVLRVGVAGEFLGHGIFALQGKAQWIKWIESFLSVDTALAIYILFFIGCMDLVVAALVILRPMRPLYLWAAVWGFWTALLRPIMGEPVWDFIERWANWAAPLALYLMSSQVRSERKK